VFNTILRFFQRYGFFKREPVVNWLGKDGLVNVAEWQNATWFYSKPDRLIRVTEDGIISMEPAAIKNRRLAEIAKERAWLYENKADLIAKKKGFYVRLRALKNAEMAVEQGKPEPGK